MKYLKPLFDIQRVHIEGSKLYYELFYRQDSTMVKLVDACFLSLKATRDHRDYLIEDY